MKGLMPSTRSTGDPGQFFARRGLTSENTRLPVSVRDIGADPGQTARYSMGLGRVEKQLRWSLPGGRVQGRVNKSESELNPQQPYTPADGVANATETVYREGRTGQTNDSGVVALPSAGIAMRARAATQGPSLRSAPRVRTGYDIVDEIDDLLADMNESGLDTAYTGVDTTVVNPGAARRPARSGPTTETETALFEQQRDNRDAAVDSGAVEPTETPLSAISPIKRERAGLMSRYGTVQRVPKRPQGAVFRDIYEQNPTGFRNVPPNATIFTSTLRDVLDPTGRQYRPQQHRAEMRLPASSRATNKFAAKAAAKTIGQPKFDGGGAGMKRRRSAVSDPVVKKFKDMTARLGKL